ncbi:MAG: LCP family protein [Chloroflexales bacterium]|jgi:polyisoprenyl-teichoic acid--peptidoglycan teichoic acid transferase
MVIGCDEARQMIDAGRRPGTRDRQLVMLGFHMANCTACRDYRDQVDMTLLDALLATPLAPPVPRGARDRRRLLLRYVAILGMVLLSIVFGRVAFAAYTISQNVAAMQVSIPVSTALAPTLPVPTDGETPQRGVFGPPVAHGAEPPPPVPTPIPTMVGDPVGFIPSPTPVTLPSIVGGAPVHVPTLMPTAPIIPVSNRAVNVLLLGSDRRAGESWTTRSDSLVIIHLDPEHQRVALLSLPRDLIVPIPGYGQARINAATVYGDMDPALGGGLALARRTVSEYLDIPIDYVLRTDFHAFTAAVDAIGGVDVNVPEALYDPAYPTMDYGYTVAAFDPGMQHMDGETALVYARIRHSDSGYARNRRQQQILLSILTEVRQHNILSQVEMISNLSTALRDDIQTDMSMDRMIGLAWAFRGVSPDKVERYALDETMVKEGVLADDPYATFAEPGAVNLVVSQLIGRQ